MEERERRKQFREMLMEEKRRLWGELRQELFEKLGQELQGQHDIPHDLAERGILDLLEDTGLAVADIHRERLTMLEEALVRLEQGTYGICELCGKRIDGERLRVAPYAASCISCQEELERGAARRRAASL